MFLSSERSDYNDPCITFYLRYICYKGRSLTFVSSATLGVINDRKCLPCAIFVIIQNETTVATEQRNLKVAQSAVNELLSQHHCSASKKFWKGFGSFRYLFFIITIQLRFLFSRRNYISATALKEKHLWTFFENKWGKNISNRQHCLLLREIALLLVTVRHRSQRKCLRLTIVKY